MQSGLVNINLLMYCTITRRQILLTPQRDNIRLDTALKIASQGPLT